ncbi:MAG TPA: hypothetical protein VK083_22200 [Nocardia sp.]|uniref:hypothetical protein n=1 Tax=Nocardia TaxID=1817 RepID=UPI002453B875|nr:MULTISPECIES: hypothetical protein [Nocardia]HLS79502.1 hypothetical protein [Nocardia sp.]
MQTMPIRLGVTPVAVVLRLLVCALLPAARHPRARPDQRTAVREAQSLRGD